MVTLAEAKRLRVYPCNAPGMPPIHPDFEAYASSIGATPEQLINRILYSEQMQYLTLPVNKSGNKVTVNVGKGSLLGGIHGLSSKATGPRPADIMFVGKCLSKNDIYVGCPYSKGDGEILVHSLRKAGFGKQEIANMYVTSLLKTTYLDSSKNSLPSLWLDQQRHLLWQEIMLVRPSIIVLQGSEAVKALLGRSATLAKCESKVMTIEIDARTSDSQPEDKFEVKLVSTINPNAVLYAKGNLGQHKESAYSMGMTTEEKRLVQNMRYLRSIYDPESTSGNVIQYDDADNDVSKVGQIFVSEGLKYYVVDNHRQLCYHLTKMRNEARGGVVAWDAEWQGNHPQDNDAYLRCMQFSYRTDSAVVIALTHPFGEPRFKYLKDNKEWTTEDGTRMACMLCHKYMDGLRAAGHFFNADLEWMVPNGLDLRKCYAPAESPEAARTTGGLALELAAHAIEETAKMGLDEQLMINTDCPNYNSAFIKSKADERKAILSTLSKLVTYRKKIARIETALAEGKKLSKERQEVLNSFNQQSFDKQHAEALHKRQELDKGYGWISDETLYPYAAWDAAGELVLAYKFFLDGGLDADRFGNDCWRPYWTAHKAAPAVLEINCTGLLVDKTRVDTLAEIFTNKRYEMLADLRAKFNWPDFNPQNRFHIAEAILGDRYNGYCQQYGVPKRFRPEGALSLQILPIRTTGKYPKNWAEIDGTAEEKQYTPSAGKQTLGELFYMEDKVVVYEYQSDGTRVLSTKDVSGSVREILDYKFMSKAVQGMLREPLLDEDGVEVTDEDGNLMYADGVTEYTSDDGYCRTHITQTAETGRWKSRSPAMQNLSKSRDADYRRITGDPTLPSIRSLFTSPKGWFLVEADYSGAELLVLAVMAQDATMIDHCKRAGLPEDHPDYKDIHAGIAVTAFKLDCPPTKNGLKGIGKAPLRVAAKAVIFGLAYGQSAAACAALLRQSGTFITEQEASALQEAIFKLYPEVRAFLSECRNRVSVGWLCNMFGRYRRFFYSDNMTDMKKQQREAMNAPIQGGVADAVSLAISNIYDYRNKTGMDFKIALQIHDAVMLYVPHYELLKVIDPVDGVFKRCMTDGVKLRPTSLDGDIISDDVYHFNSSMDIYGAWGEPPMPDAFLDYNLDPALAHWQLKDGFYVHDDFSGLKWARSHGLVPID